MFRRWQSVFSIILLMAVLLACRLSGSSPINPTLPVPGFETAVRPETPRAEIERLNMGDNAQWPAYIPDDIPVLEGKIRRVFEDETRIRIIYEDMTLERVKDYLRLLEKQGFHLEYIVYVEEGFPDNSAERMKKGDYDEVNITRGEYHMKIGYGEGHIGYDIYTTGFEDAIPSPSGLDWPVGLLNVVPQPERCLIETINPTTPGTYQITCRPADDQVASEYIQALQAAGFRPEPVEGSPNATVYARGDLGVSIEQHSTALVSISISTIDRSNTTWPSALSGVVPAPEACPVKNVLEKGGQGYLISCDAESEQAISNYIDLLASEGFNETQRMETQSGEVVSLNFEKDNLKVWLMISPPLRLMIDVSGK